MERLPEEIRERDACRAELEKQLGEMDKQLGEKENEMADLERQLALRKQNSTNSPKPPSSDGLAGEPRERGRANESRRKPGGQPGYREFIEPRSPPEEWMRFETFCPNHCQAVDIVSPSQIEQVQL